MSGFIIADITNPRSAALELQAIAVTRREEPGSRGAMTENGGYVIYAPEVR
jgi:hypothetical protein